MAELPFKPNLTVSPTVAAIGMPSQNKNFAEIIGKAFDDFGDIYKEKEKREERQVDMADKNLAREVSQINLGELRKGIHEKNSFGKLLASNQTVEEWNAQNKDSAITNPEYVKTAQDYFTKKKELFTKEETEKAVGLAKAKYIIDGKYDHNGAIKDLQGRFASGEIKDSVVFAGAMDVLKKLHEENKPKYTDSQVKTTENGKEVTKTVRTLEDGTQKVIGTYDAYIDPVEKAYKEAQTAKIMNDIKNSTGGSGKTPKSKLEIAKVEYDAEVKYGITPSTTEFDDWYKNGGGLKLKTEGITTPKNKLTEQFSGLDKIQQLVIDVYDPSKYGMFDGMVQGIQELTNTHTTGSATVEAGRLALINALAQAEKGVASDKDIERIKGEIGSAMQTEAGASTKILTQFRKGLISTKNTLDQLRLAGADVKEQTDLYTKKANFYNSIQEWDGSVTIPEYLRQKEAKKNANNNNEGVAILKQNPNAKIKDKNNPLYWLNDNLGKK